MTINNRFDYIFIDLDGPILEGKYRHYNCYKDIINSFSGEAMALNEYWNMKRNKNNRKFMLEKSNFKGSYDEFMNNWLKLIENEYYLNFDILKPNVIESLLRLKRITKKLVLVTMRNNKKNLIKQLNKLKIEKIFDEVIVCGSHLKNSKYESLKNKEFESAVIIGDTEEDTNTAKMLNIKSIGILNGLRSKKHLDANYYFDEITNAKLFTILLDELEYIKRAN